MESVQVVEVRRNAEYELVKKTAIAIADMNAAELQDMAARVASVIEVPNIEERDNNLMNLVVFNAKLKKFSESLDKEIKAELYNKMENLFNDGTSGIKNVSGVDITSTASEVWDFSSDEKWGELNSELIKAESNLVEAKGNIKTREDVLKKMQKDNPIGYDYLKGKQFKSATVKVK